MSVIITYIGLFMDRNDLLEAMEEAGLGGNHLTDVIPWPHVTFIYLPQDLRRELYGHRAEVEILSYGNNGRSEGLGVRIHCDDPRIMALAGEIPVPHITVSKETDVKAVETRDLDFQPVKGFTINAVFGGYDPMEDRPVF